MSLRSFALAGVGLGCTVLLAGCQQNSISETQLNQRIERQLTTQASKPLQLRAGQLNMQYTIDTIQVDLQSQQGGRAISQLTGTLTGQLQIFGQPIKLAAPFNPVLASGLRYDKGQIFLANPTVESWGQPLPPALQPYVQQLQQMAAEHLKAVPVYQLDNSLEEKLAAKMLRDIQIKDDRLQFLF